MLEGHLPLPSLDQKYMVHAINPFVFSNIFNPAPKTHVNLIVLVLISVGKKKTGLLWRSPFVGISIPMRNDHAERALRSSLKSFTRPASSRPLFADVFFWTKKKLPLLRATRSTVKFRHSSPALSDRSAGCGWCHNGVIGNEVTKLDQSGCFLLL